MPLQYIRADITKVQTDAIVNAANPTLLGGGGVDGAIHKAAGPGLLDECKKLGGCSAGEAKITKGYDLPCKYVIHTVGPVWRGGWHGEEKQLRACYRNSLELAEANGCESLAFPLISAGAYGYPKDKALKVATEAIQAFLNDHEMNVTLVVFAKEEFEISSKLYRSVKCFIDDEYAEARNLRNRISQIYAARQDDEFWNPGAAVDDAPEAETLPDAIMPKYQVAEKKSKAYQPSARKSEQPCESFFGNAVYDESMAGPVMDPLIPDDLKRIMEIQDEGFKGMLIRKIGETGMTDAQCYKKANIDRRHFNHLINDPAPKPKKRTVLAFALALRLNRDEAEELLKKAGFAFSPADKTDKIIQYCIRIGAYDINEINQILFAYDLQPLGC